MSRNRRPSARLEAVGEKNPKGRIVVRHRVVDSLARMRQAGTIDAPMLDAGREFQRSSILAQFDPLQLAVRNRVHRALLALGGHDSPAGSCAWHILGCGQSVREWALRQGWAGRPMRQEHTQGMLVAALGLLAAHYGFSEAKRASWTYTPSSTGSRAGRWTAEVRMNGDLEGGCACGAVRYRLAAAPMFVHCCHCHDCQRQTGSAFVLNAMIETDRIILLSGTLEPVPVPTDSGRPHDIHRCRACRTALWSDYGHRPALRFVRIGTLDEPARLPPDVHIYTRSKLPWLELPKVVPVFEAYYDTKALWPAASLERRRAILG